MNRQALVLILSFFIVGTNTINPQEFFEQALFKKNDYQPFATDAVAPSLVAETSLAKQAPRKSQAPPTKKPWTFFVYIAARNDLHPFAKTNLRQMLDVGSNENINIVAEFHEPGKKGMQRFYIEKNNLMAYQDSQRFNSGDPETLINFAEWGVANFPAEHYALVIWDHGIGSAIDPYISRSLDPLERFTNPTSRDNYAPTFIQLPAFIEEKHEEPRHGICFDDSYKSYITGQGLLHAFKGMQERFMHEKKWDIVGLDACLMADIPTTFILKDYADYLVTSEDAIPGPGFHYRLALTPFQQRALTPEEFAQHLVATYAQAYSPYINDYALSAIALKYMYELEAVLQDISRLLLEGLEIQKDQSVKEAIRLSCNRRLCTSFDEPSYKDLHHLMSNIAKNCELFRFNDQARGEQLCTALRSRANECLAIIKKAVIANTVGKTWAQAQGISIYMPETRMHSSFTRTPFGMTHAWHHFLKQFLAA